MRQEIAQNIQTLDEAMDILLNITTPLTVFEIRTLFILVVRILNAMLKRELKGLR